MKWSFRYVGLLAAAVLLSGCWGNDYSWNQKLAVTVETPDGPRTGAAVTQVVASVGQQGLLSAAIVGYSVKGEATVVDLGNGRYLFALLSRSGNPTEYWMEHTFSGHVTLTNKDGGVEELKEKYGKLTRLRGVESMPSNRYPLLVTFGDIKDPKSVQKVDPRDLAASFGAGYSLVSFTLEITDEPMTEGKVEKVLGWLKTLQGALVPTKAFKPATEYKPEEELGREHFILGG